MDDVLTVIAITELERRFAGDLGGLVGDDVLAVAEPAPGRDETGGQGRYAGVGELHREYEGGRTSGLLYYG